MQHIASFLIQILRNIVTATDANTSSLTVYTQASKAEARSSRTHQHAQYRGNASFDRCGTTGTTGVVYEQWWYRCHYTNGEQLAFREGQEGFECGRAHR